MSATATAIAVATAMTAVAAQFVRIRQSAQIHRLVHKTADGVLHLVNFFLSIEETLGDGIVQEGVTVSFKAGDFLRGKRDSVLLFLL